VIAESHSESKREIPEEEMGNLLTPPAALMLRAGMALCQSFIIF
jgi:NAD(P)H-hydrate repair Nnr-like enzyme with NAD(P)H-hydrate epimerase domain